MFTRSGSSSGFDSVILMEGTIRRPDASGEVLVDAVMMYVNQKTGISYGSCKVTKNLLSKETLVVFDKFIESIEEDFGRIAFGEGIITNPNGASIALGTAEDPEGKIDPKSLGGV